MGAGETHVMLWSRWPRTIRQRVTAAVLATDPSRRLVVVVRKRPAHRRRRDDSTTFPSDVRTRLADAGSTFGVPSGS